MEHWSWMQDEAPDPMLQEQFQLALDATQIRTPELIEACRSVLVDGKLATEVALLPMNVRGYESVKERSITTYRSELAERMTSWSTAERLSRVR